MNDQKLFREVLTARSAAAGVTVDSQQVRAMSAYYELLRRWNRRVNLTALPLEPLTNGAIDRLFIEPLAAAEVLGKSFRDWIDFGSGGGSPAIPMKTVWPEIRLTMVESRSRKASFLREAVREIPLVQASVLESRFENVSGIAATADLVTVRAVRADSALYAAAHLMLKAGGRLAMFGSIVHPPLDHDNPSFTSPETYELPAQSFLVIWRRTQKQ